MPSTSIAAPCAGDGDEEEGAGGEKPISVITHSQGGQWFWGISQHPVTDQMVTTGAEGAGGIPWMELRETNAGACHPVTAGCFQPSSPVLWGKNTFSFTV